MGIFRVVKTKDYTVINNYLCKDRRLSLKGKGLLTVMLSLPEDWDYTIRGLSAILLEGERAISSTLKELEALGYLERNVLRNKRGIITDTEYIIYEQPKNPVKIDEEPPKYAGLPQADFPLVDSADVDSSHPDNGGQLNTNKLNTKELNNILSSAKKAEPEIIPVTYEEAHDRITENIEYDRLLITNPEDMEMIDEIVGVMSDVVSSEADTVRINRKQVEYSQVRDRFLAVKRKHMEHILKALKTSETDIKSIRSYIKTCVYNSITACTFEKKQHKKQENKAINLFNSFPQRQYNFDDMDNSLIIINQ